MKRYELIFIIHPDLNEEEVKAVTEKFLQIISAQQGILIKTEDWGKRRLAYEIKKQPKGTYVLVDFYGPGNMILEIERNLKIDDKILKFLTIKTKDPFDPESLEEEKRRAQLLQEAQLSAEAPEPAKIIISEAGENEIEKEGE